MHYFKFLLCFGLLFLTGCKGSIETRVNISDLLSTKTKDIVGDLYVEVPSCTSYKDSRQESDSLQKAKTQISNIFTGAQFNECFTKQFKSYAHFHIPMVLERDNDGKLASETKLNIQSSEDNLLAVGFPSSIAEKLKRLEESSLRTQSLDIEVNIEVVNDTGKSHSFRVISAYIDGDPYVYESLSAPADSSFLVTLSNVSVDNAKQNGSTFVLLH
ncbi:hypothetical protein KIH87_03460 [Paraneptunicella aestuarii]|uniref:DUF7424 family protein n=1 Tax=Paraneptunicella aestuarii TaxID=2831148 RepID=UPI001E2A3FD6|nr:hypothetical protein [Paraneptunicella aestuarii]UAA39427.1 hypothetical protein KIH87_03460 [Paraneptunicella aestuarii]